MVKRSRLRKGDKDTWTDRKKRVKVWKPISWVKQSRNEYQRYMKTKDLKLLAQSGEKIWSAFTLHVDKKLGKIFISFSEMYDAVKASKDREFVDRFDDALALHSFFYRGFTEDKRIQEDKWQKVYDYLKKRVG